MHKKGHFKGMKFNRVIKNFIIQGGDVERSGDAEDWTARGKHYSQLVTSLKHEAFMLGTSKTRHKDGRFDLVITTAHIPDLNQKINIFRRVIKGEDVVQEIKEANTDEHYRPKSRIEITEVTLKQKILKGVTVNNNSLSFSVPIFMVEESLLLDLDSTSYNVAI